MKDLKTCAGTFANLTNAEPATLPPGATSIQWWTTITRAPGTQVADKTAVPAGTYYAFYDPLIVNCPSQVTVSYYVATDPEFPSCITACYDDAATGTGVATNHGITLLQRAGADNGNWPMIRTSAHTVLESNTKGFVITRMTTGQIDLIASPQDGMMVYDTDSKCMKIYTIETLPAITGWKCYLTPACP